MKVLLIIIVVYIILALAARYVFPLILRSYLKRFNDRMNQNNQQYNIRKEGEIHIDHIPEKDKNSNSDQGDYVDYEEIK